jgi:peptide/nickel transport system ATP-binding protein
VTGERIAIAADDLSLDYPRDRRAARGLAVNGVSFAVPRGAVLGIVGEAGAGKSTLARTIAGLAGLSTTRSPRIAGGALTVLGQPMRHIGRRARDRHTLKVGYLPQDGGAQLEARLTVGENVAAPIFSRDRHFDRRVAGAAVATLIDAVQLPLGVLAKYPHELSKGQRQRVALARALVLEPELLVADDPTMGVDVLARGPILDVIGDIRARREFTVVVVAHEVGELRRITDRIAVMHQGMIVGLGRIDDVLARPGHDYVDRLAAEYRLSHPRHAAPVGA